MQDTVLSHLLHGGLSLQKGLPAPLCPVLAMLHPATRTALSNSHQDNSLFGNLAQLPFSRTNPKSPMALGPLCPPPSLLLPLPQPLTSCYSHNMPETRDFAMQFRLPGMHFPRVTAPPTVCPKVTFSTGPILNARLHTANGTLHTGRLPDPAFLFLSLLASTVIDVHFVYFLYIFLVFCLFSTCSKPQ